MKQAVLPPLAEQQLSGRLAELGARMMERRFVLAQPHAGQMAVDLARTSPAKFAPTVSGTPAAGALILGSVHRDHRTALVRA